MVRPDIQQRTSPLGRKRTISSRGQFVCSGILTDVCEKVLAKIEVCMDLSVTGVQLREGNLMGG